MRNHFTRFSGLRFRLILLGSLTLLPILGLMLYTYQEQRQLAITEAQQNALRLARLAANDQEHLIEGARQLLVALAQLPSVQDQDAAACSLFMFDLLREYPLYENLGVANLEGDIFCSAILSATMPNVADRPWFQRALETRDFVAGDYITARITGRATMGTAHPVIDGAGRARAVVFAGIDLQWLDRFVAEAQLPEGSTLTVVDQGGTVLTRYPDPERWRGTPLPGSMPQSLSAQGEGAAEAEGLDGVPRLYAFTTLCCLPGGDIYLRVGIPKAVAFADANRALTRNLITLGVVTLLVVGLAAGGAQLFVLRPLDALLGIVRRFDAGDFGVRTGQAPGGGELGQLARAFDQMAATVEARETETKRSQEELRMQSARAKALATTAARLNTHLDLQGVLKVVCQETARALQVSAVSVSLYDEKLDALRIVSHCGLPEDFGEQIAGLGWSTCTKRLERGEAEVIPDVQAHPEWPFASLFAALDIRTFVTTPMVHEGRLVGTLCVFARGETRRFAETELAFLKAIADQAAQAIANARLYDALRREERSRAALLEKTISAQEEERKRIARELHDQTSQDLAALVLSLDACAMDLAAEGPRSAPHLQTAKSIAETMLTNIHRLINDLRPSLLDDLGLAPAIIWYGEQRLKSMGAALEFQCDRMEARLAPPLETALFRITQEALTNVVRHADASRVKVTLKVSDVDVFLTVEDNGTGFQISAAAPGEAEGRGLGLRGMEERVSTLGGQLEIRSAPGQGTLVAVNIPLPKEGQPDVQNSRALGR
jgi:signal transduction histidine kinase